VIFSTDFVCGYRIVCPDGTWGLVLYFFPRTLFVVIGLFVPMGLGGLVLYFFSRTLSVVIGLFVPMGLGGACPLFFSTDFVFGYRIVRAMGRCISFITSILLFITAFVVRHKRLHFSTFVLLV